MRLGLRKSHYMVTVITGPLPVTKKGIYLHLFDIWLVRNVIANLLLVPRLEKEIFFLTYENMTTWTIQCPDGTILKLNIDRGLYGRFPYLYLKQHNDAVVIIKTVCQNY